MSNNTSRKRLQKAVVAGAVVLGVAGGSYGIASAASGAGGTAASNATPSAARTAPPLRFRGGSDPQKPWGGQRSDETPLTGDNASKVRELALGKVSGATVVRVETDADGNAAYEAHLVKADGTPATVYVDKQFNVVGVETR